MIEFREQTGRRNDGSLLGLRVRMLTALGIFAMLIVLLPMPSASASGRTDLALTITDTPDPAVVGDEVTYTIYVANNGPQTAKNLRVEIGSVYGPAGYSPISVQSAHGTCSGMTCTIGSLERGKRATVTVRKRYLDKGTFQLTANVSPGAGQTDQDWTNNYATAYTTIRDSNFVARNALGCGGAFGAGINSGECYFIYGGGPLTVSGAAEGVGNAMGIGVAIYRADTSELLLQCGDGSYDWFAICKGTSAGHATVPVGTTLKCTGSISGGGPGIWYAPPPPPVGAFDCFNGTP